MMLSIEFPHGTLLVIRRQMDPQDWTPSIDWQRSHDHNEVAKKIARKVRRACALKA